MNNSGTGGTPVWGRANGNSPASDEVIELFLNPGEYFVGGAGFQVRTLLGSCVSIVLWHQRLRFGAMSHYLLPSRPGRSTLPHEFEAARQLDGKYADEVLRLMAKKLCDAKIPLAECHARIFGGGNMFPDRSIINQFDIGLKNGEAAKRLLAAYEIPIVSENLFGFGHREIIFNTGNGEVWMRQVKLELPAKIF